MRGGVLMSGTGVPIKETLERPPCPFLMSVHSEKTAGSESWQVLNHTRNLSGPRF